MKWYGCKVAGDKWGVCGGIINFFVIYLGELGIISGETGVCVCGGGGGS